MREYFTHKKKTQYYIKKEYSKNEEEFLEIKNMTAKKFLNVIQVLEDQVEVA